MKSGFLSLLNRLAWLAACLLLAYPMASHGWMKIKPHFTAKSVVDQSTTSLQSDGEDGTGTKSEHDAANYTKGEVQENPNIEKRRNYIRSLKETGFMWELVGILELLGAALLLIRPVQFLGSAVLWPLTLNVFLFHAVLEPEKTGELIFTSCMLIANTVLLFRYWSKWRHLLFITHSPS